MSMAYEAVARWAADDYPADLLGRMRDDLSARPKGPGWTTAAMTVASTAEHVGAALFAAELAREVIEFVAAGELADLHAQMWARSTLAAALLRSGDYATAVAEYEQAIEFARRIYDRRTEASTLTGLADANLRRVRAHAAVRADAEGEVPVGGPREVDHLGVGELGRVPVGGDGVEQDPVAAAHRAAAQPPRTSGTAPDDQAGSCPTSARRMAGCLAG